MQRFRSCVFAATGIFAAGCGFDVVVGTRITDGGASDSRTGVDGGPETDGGAPDALAPCSQHATPTTFASVFDSAAGGAVICLASGSYGTFEGGSKSATVTVRPEAGATPTMALSLRAANNLHLDGLTITGGDVSGTSRDIAVSNCRFTDVFMIDHTEPNANLLFDRNTHADIGSCTQCDPARIAIRSTGTGITIQNSTFSGGTADGIHDGGNEVSIIGNVFDDISQHSTFDNHTIFLTESHRTIIRGNFIHDCSTGIAAYDGADHEIIEDNVLDVRARPYAIELYADNGSIVRHNTFQYGSCLFGQVCGTIALDRKPTQQAGLGTVIVDNILTDITVANGSTWSERHHNLVRTAATTGDVVGTPAFVGGASPATFDGFHLATGSPGKAAASDGSDVGVP